MARVYNIFVLLSFFVVLFVSQGADAQKILQDFKKPMPEMTLLPEAEFAAKTTLYEEVPMGEKSFAYKLRLPKDWKSIGDMGVSTGTSSNNVLGEIAKFFGPPRIDGARSFFSMQAINIDYQLTAEQWMLQYLLTSGYNIQGMESKADARAEALYVLIDRDISYIVRAAAVITGKKIILAQYYLPIEYWEEEKVQQSQAVSSFSLVTPNKEYIETIVKYHFLDLAEISYPESWELRAPPLRSLDSMSVELLNVAGEQSLGNVSLDGKIDIKLVSLFSSESLISEKKVLMQEFEASGLVLGEELEKRTDFKFVEDFKAPVIEVYYATDSKNNLMAYELWVATMQAGDYYYLLTLLTPARDEDYFIWSRNTQTFKLVSSMIEPQDEAEVKE